MCTGKEDPTRKYSPQEACAKSIEGAYRGQSLTRVRPILEQSLQSLAAVRRFIHLPKAQLLQNLDQKGPDYGAARKGVF